MATLFHYGDDDFCVFHAYDEHPDPCSFTMHAHREPEIYCFLSGRAEYRIEGSVYMLSPGDVLLMRTAEAHMLQIDPSEPYERLVYNVKPEFLNRTDPSGALSRLFFDRPLGTNNRFRLHVLADGAFFDFLSALPCGNDPALCRMVLISRMLVILSDALREGPADRLSASGRAAEILRYVNEHLFEELSLKMIAEQFYLSRSQLSRVIRSETGSGIMEYVRIKRLIAARDKIRAGVSAARAAEECGFQDYSSFFRAYKARFGKSPGERD